MAKGRADDGLDKIILLNTALSCFLDAMDSGAHSAYNEAQKIQQELLRLSKDQSTIEETKREIKKHSGILEELSTTQTNLIHQLLSK
jgi:hypothetical protein